MMLIWRLIWRWTSWRLIRRGIVVVAHIDPIHLVVSIVRNLPLVSAPLTIVVKLKEVWGRGVALQYSTQSNSQAYKVSKDKFNLQMAAVRQI